MFTRHCELYSEAIQGLWFDAFGLLRRFVPRNDATQKERELAIVNKFSLRFYIFSFIFRIYLMLEICLRQKC
jgi:hypothetical protein